MYSFRNDYSEGAHPAVLKALQESNAVQSARLRHRPLLRRSPFPDPHPMRCTGSRRSLFRRRHAGKPDLLRSIPTAL